MKTIKFRGKRFDNGEWVYGYYARLRNEFNEWHCIMTEEDASDNYIKDCNGYNMIYTPVNHDTVGQFTGLYDKNGEEIYEGDILQWGEGDYKIKQVVMFLHGAFGYKCDPYTFVSYVGNSNFNFCAKGTDNRFEIIGNIHDNPELQKGGEE